MTSPDIYLNAEQGYNSIAPFYDDWNWQKIWTAIEWPHIHRMIRNDRFKTSPRILDIGAGTGRTLEALHREFRYAVLSGVDVSDGMLDIARGRLPDKAVLIQKHAKQLAGLESSSFSHVLFCRVGSHVPNLIQALAEATRVVLPGGKIFTSDIHPDHHYIDTHVRLPGQTVHVETYKHTMADWERAHNLGLVMRFHRVVRGAEIMALPGIDMPKSVTDPDQPVSMMMVLEKR